MRVICHLGEWLIIPILNREAALLSARTPLISSNNIVQIWEYVSHSSVQVGDAPIFFIFFLKTIAPKCCLSLCPLLTHYCWCDWDKKGESGRGGEGWKGHAWVVKIQMISTILKFQFSLAPRFSLAGPEGKKQTNKKRPCWSSFSSAPPPPSVCRR